VNADRVAIAPSALETPSTAGSREKPAIDPALFAPLFQQNWENVRNIKHERISFMSMHAIVSTGALSLLQSLPGEFVLQASLLLFLCLASLIGLITSLRLKDELEECFEKLHMIVVRAQVDELVALERMEGRRSWYPAFRWVFPVQYILATLLFVGLLLYQLALAGRP
jgi:hypothetical protein